MKKAKSKQIDMFGGVVLIALKDIDDPVRAMRGALDGESLTELAKSIKDNGLINPVMVKKVKGRFEIVAGHRRLRAFEILKQAKIPAIVTVRGDSELDIVKMHENLQREDVNPLDEAGFMLDVMSAYKMNQAVLARRIGKSEAYVSDRIALLRSDDYIREAVKSGTLSFSAARELVKVKNSGVRKTYVEHAIKSGVTPGEAARWAADANTYSPVAPDGASSDTPCEESAPPDIPKYDCAGCGKAVDVRELALVKMCRDCARAVKDSPRESAPANRSDEGVDEKEPSPS